ncbi:hypothetical protein A2U01_0059731, partial [Trifolium medium]|nr:hypothetical protein [Trifolium medium]
TGAALVLLAGFGGLVRKEDGSWITGFNGTFLGIVDNTLTELYDNLSRAVVLNTLLCPVIATIRDMSHTVIL